MHLRTVMGGRHNARALKLDKTGKLRLSEADVTKQVCDFLAVEGWRGVRMNVGGISYTPTGFPPRFVQFGEKGMSDWLFIRYEMIWRIAKKPSHYGMANVMWLEMKAPGKKPKPHQLAWHEAERARGALVKVVDHFETFRDWYRGTFS